MYTKQDLTFNITEQDPKPYSLKTGRLRTLFYMLESYRHTKDPGILNDISDELSWFDNYNLSHPSNNYALFSGRLGIGYFYLELFRTTGENNWLEKATSVAHEYFGGNAFQYDIIGSYGLYDGIAGVILFTLHLYLETREQWLLEHMEKLLLKLISKANMGDDRIYWGGVTNRDGRNTGIATGTAGIAFVLSELGKCFNNSFLISLAAQAMKYEHAILKEPGKEDGAFDLPVSSETISISALPEQSVFRAENPELRNTFIRCNFKGTWSLLENSFPEVLSAFNKKYPNAGIGDFATYIKQILSERNGSPEAGIALFEFEKEEFILSIRRSLKMSSDTTDLSAETLEIERLMYLETEEFVNLRLVQSDKIKVFSWEPAVRMDSTFSVPAFAYLFQNYGEKTCFCSITGDDTLNENFPKIIKLVFDRFKQPQTIRNAQEELIRFIFSQEPGSIQLLKDHYFLKTDHQLLDRILALVVDGARLYLMEKFLEVAH